MKRVLFFLFVSITLWGSVNQNNDVQLWVTEAVNTELAPSWILHLSNEWRIGNDISELYFFYLQGIVSYQMCKEAIIGPGFRQIWHLAGTRWRLTSEPLVDLIVLNRKGNLEVSLRNRFSYLIREEETHLFQYRGRTRISTFWETGGLTIQAYLSNEVFVRAQKGFTQDRLMIGTVIPFFKNMNGDFYYMLRFLDTSYWTHQHVFGTWFNVNF